MAEPATTSVGSAVVFTGATGATILLSLSMMGIDLERLGAGLFGAIIAIAFFPSKDTRSFKLALLVFASMLLASFVGPFVAPAVRVVGDPLGVPAVHATSVACAIVGAFPKPIVVLVRATWIKFLQRYGVKDVDPPL
jgi:hypothetical protein